MDFLHLYLDKTLPQPLYAQLYGHLVAQIRAGRLRAGERLPGKRTAAAQLGVSVNTVDEAYQMLAAEGYVQARPRSGFTVCRLEQQVPGPQAAGALPPPGRAAGEPEPASGAFGHGGATPWRHSFASGDLDLSLFPLKTWNRLLRETLAAEPGLFAQGEAFGDAALRSAIAVYLQDFRGVRCRPGQVVAGAGLEVLLGMLARLLAGARFAVEDPGYPKTAGVLRNMGLEVCPAPVDAAGLVPEALERCGARAAYLTPSHQFPTGGVMPVGRRLELLRWAALGGRWLIEDDYDSEFRFDGRPLPCLQGLDEAGRVVYAGTFSRSLAPGLRAAYLVLPPALLQRWQAAYGGYACTISRPEQHTLARLMDGGHFARSLNRLRSAYRARRGSLLQALEQALPPGQWTAENTHTGLYFILRLPGRSAVQAARQARRQGLNLRAVDEYRFEPGSGAESQTADALVLGYGGLAQAETGPAAQALAQAVF